MPPIKVVMTLDDSGFTTHVERAGRQLRELKGDVQRTHRSMRDMEHGMGGFATKFKDIVFGLSILRFAFADFHDIILSLPIAFVKAGGEMERMMALMKGLSKETDELKKKAEAVKNTQFVFELAANAPFELKTITDMFVKLKTAGLDPTDGSMKALTNSLAKFGATDEQAKRASIAIQQMAGKGVISMEELRQQLGEAVPNAMQMMARGMGMSMAELTKAVSKGTVASTMALKKMLVQMEIDAMGASARMMNTIPGAIAALKTEWELFKIEGAGGGIDGVIKEQIQGLTKFFQSQEGKQFARDLGEGMKAAAEGVIALKDAFVFLWPAIKLVGQGLLFYFGGSLIKAAYASAVSRIDAVKKSVDDTRLAASAANAAQVREAKAAIDVNRVQLGLKAKAINSVMGQEKAAHDTKLQQLRTQLSALKDSESAERSLIAKRQVAYADYKAALAQINETQAKLAAHGAQPGVAAAGAKQIAAMQAVAIAIREEIRTSSAKIASLKSEREAQIASTNAKIASTQASTAHIAAGQQRIATLKAEHGALLASNREHLETITNFGKMTTAGAAVLGTMKNIGMTLLSTVGWSLAFTAAMSAVVFIYDKLAGSAKRAAEEMERVQRIKNKEATRADRDAKAETVSDLRAGLKGLYETRKRMTANPPAKYNVGNRPQADPRADLDQRIAEAESKLRQASGLLELADRTVQEAESVASGERLGTKLGKTADDTMRMTQVWKDLTVANTKLALIDKVKDKAKWEKANTESHDLTVLMLKERMVKIKAAYDEALPQAKKDGEQAERLLAQAYESQLSGTRAALETVLAKNDINAGGKGNKGAGRAARAAAKESKILQYVMDKQVEFAKAKGEYESLITDVRDFTAAAENDQMSEIIGKLISGDFDVAPDNKGKNGKSPGGNTETRKNLLANFMAFKGTALEFLDTLEDLDVKTGRGEETAGQYFATLIKGAGPMAELTRAGRAMNSLQSKGAAITQELTDAQSEYDAGVNYIPPKLAAFSREMAVLAKQSGLTDERLAEFNATVVGMSSDILKTSLLRAEVTSRKAADDARIAGIFNVQDREAAAHAATLARIKAEYDARKREIFANVADASERAKLMVLLEQDTTNKRLVEGDRYATASETPLDKMAKGWNDFAGNTRQVVANVSKDWMDSLFDLVTGTETSLRAMVESTLRQFARLAFDKAMGGAMNAFGSYITAAIGGAGFANGGIMSSAGPLPLKMYQAGGIARANEPQLAVFGEGRMNEAYVPLPDGRSIPVSLKGGKEPVNQTASSPNVMVNVINQSGTAVNAKQKGLPRFDGRQMILDVVLEASQKPGPFRDGFKSMNGG